MKEILVVCLVAAAAIYATPHVATARDSVLKVVTIGVGTWHHAQCEETNERLWRDAACR